MIGSKVLVRTYSAGVFFGDLKMRDGKECVLTDAVRIWYWAGACSLSQIAMEGVKKPTECKFAVPVKEILLTEAIEFIPLTKKAAENLSKVPTWKSE